MHLENCTVKEGQGTKGIRWMPRRQVPTKGVASDEMLWGAASRRRSKDTRMGEPAAGDRGTRM